ncbi:D-lactate dehydrogenase [Trichophaea hybrida]|nr:D-lactate dehydrogenase [Trichophaea hybrida]
MKVIIFGANKYNQDSFDQVNSGTSGIEFSYFEVKLDPTTAVLATGHEAVCIFVNDQCDSEVLAQLKSLGVKYIVLRCAGFNNVDLSAASKLGFKVVHVPAYSPESVAEFAVGMIMTVVRKYHKAYLRVREGNFLLDGLLGFNLNGKIVGIVGTGKIGLLTGKILSKGFGCNVIAYDPYPNTDAATEYGISYVETLEELLRQVDILSLHCPLNDGTKYIINEKALGQTKKGVILINTSRGALIDTRALIKALKSGHLGAVGLDVYEKESSCFFSDLSSKIIYDDNFARLLSFYNVFVSGHQAFLTEEALKSIAETTIGNLIDLKNNGVSKMKFMND